jgi:hypothetical protein
MPLLLQQLDLLSQFSGQILEVLALLLQLLDVGLLELLDA